MMLKCPFIGVAFHTFVGKLHRKQQKNFPGLTNSADDDDVLSFFMKKSAYKKQDYYQILFDTV